MKACEANRPHPGLDMRHHRPHGEANLVATMIPVRCVAASRAMIDAKSYRQRSAWQGLMRLRRAGLSPRLGLGEPLVAHAASRQCA